jgi:hypothetical protein
MSWSIMKNDPHLNFSMGHSSRSYNWLTVCSDHQTASVLAEFYIASPARAFYRSISHMAAIAASIVPTLIIAAHTNGATRLGGRRPGAGRTFKIQHSQRMTRSARQSPSR